MNQAHAVGLAHTHSDNNNIMNPTTYTKDRNTIDSTHAAIDRDYINGLAILYQNESKLTTYRPYQ